jgi:hypothetical protein
VSEAHVCGALAAVEAWTHDLLPHLDLADAAQAPVPPPRARIRLEARSEQTKDALGGDQG